MNWRLVWFRATHHCISRDNWFLIFGHDMWNSDYGVTFSHGLLPPNAFSGEWKRWRVEWRINIRWPITIKRRGTRS